MEVSSSEIDSLYEKLSNDAESYGYHLNPDQQFTKDLIKGLLINKKRYGYLSCPCRLSSGEIEKDRDIICPCDYRDDDINDYGACYCGLYVSEEIINGKKKLTSIPERRYAENKIKQKKQQSSGIRANLPVWRCRVCGYLCARENPPGTCPICKVKKDRFERFM